MTVAAQLRSPLAARTAGTVMRPGVLTVDAAAPLADVARTMATHAVHAVLVHRMAGRDDAWPAVLTDVDLVRLAVEGDPARATAGDAAGDPVCMVRAGDPLDAVARVMDGLAQSHVLVAEPTARTPEGVLSTFDLVAVLGGYEPRFARLTRRARTAGAAPPRGSAAGATPAPPRARTAGPAPARRAGLAGLTVRDAMHRGVIGCPPSLRLPAVAATLAEHHVHCAVVAGVETVSAGEHLVWRVLDARDLVRAALSWDPSLPASRLATAVPAALETGEPLARAAALMLERRTTHVVASGPGGEPAGVVSTLDVAAALAGTGA